MTKTTEGLQKVKLGQASVVLVIWSFTPSSSFLPKKFRCRGIIVTLVPLPNLVSSSFKPQLPFYNLPSPRHRSVDSKWSSQFNHILAEQSRKEEQHRHFFRTSKIKEISPNSEDFKLFERKQHTGTQSQSRYTLLLVFGSEEKLCLWRGYVEAGGRFFTKYKLVRFHQIQEISTLRRFQLVRDKTKQHKGTQS